MYFTAEEPWLPFRSSEISTLISHQNRDKTLKCTSNTISQSAGKKVACLYSLVRCIPVVVLIECLSWNTVKKFPRKDPEKCPCQIK